MKILIDTNILISAALNVGGTPYQAFIKAVSFPNHGCICIQNIDEMYRIFNRKFPHRIQALEAFLSFSLLSLDVIPIPPTVAENELKIRDIKDRPIFRAAINANVDIILTGDKDFLESEIKYPLAITASDFLQL